MNIYETLKEIDKLQDELNHKVKETGTDEEWLNEAAKQGLIIKDIFKVHRNLQTYGPEISIFVSEKEYLANGESYNKLVGSAKYTSYNNKWEIHNFKKNV